jgi:hypothetical protein
MKRRFVATTILALTVLFSQGGGTVLAAICPHLRSLASSCHDMPKMGEQQMDHAMDHMGVVTPQGATGDAVETNDSSAPCSHCAVHSRNRRDDSALQYSTLVQRTDDVTTSGPLVIAASPAVETVNWIAKPHGPPGNNHRLHLLISVFRI